MISSTYCVILSRTSAEHDRQLPSGFRQARPHASGGGSAARRHEKTSRNWVREGVNGTAEILLRLLVVGKIRLQDIDAIRG
jgi:hypothetical protein